MYKKDPNDLARVVDEIDPNNAWALTEGIPTRKFDGMACTIIGGVLYKRRDIRKGKRIPDAAIECQAADPNSGHHPHWVICSRQNREDVLFYEGFDTLDDKSDGTYELCGEKISTERFQPKFNVEKISGHRLIPHGKEILEVPDRSFEGLRAYLTETDIEGIVFHHPDGRMCKIRKKDYGIER